MRQANPAALEALRTLQQRGSAVEHMEKMLAAAKVKRDRAIRSALAAGVPAATVARAAGLTAGRVSQMVSAEQKGESE